MIDPDVLDMAVPMVMLLIFAVVVVFSTFRRVPSGRVLVVERMGRYQRTLGPGVHVLMLLVDRVRADVDVQEQEMVFPVTDARTADATGVDLEVLVRFAVVDPLAAVYEVANHLLATEEAVATPARQAVESLPRADALVGHVAIAAAVGAELEGSVLPWGVQVLAVKVQAISPTGREATSTAH